MPPNTVSVLDQARYRALLAETHPALSISDCRLAGLPSFLAPLDIREPMRPGLLRTVLDRLAGLFPSVVTPKALFLGTPFERYDQSYLLSACRPMDTFTSEVRAQARAGGQEVVVMTNVNIPVSEQAAWRKLGWVLLPSFPDTVVSLAASDLDGHLATLPAGDRSGVRRNIRRFERAGHSLERIYDARQHGRALFECYLPMYERAAVRWQAHTQAYFEGLTALGDEVDLVGAFARSGQLIGFVVAFHDGSGIQAGRIGVHPDYHRKDAVYFRLMYHVLEEGLGTKKDGFLSFEPTGYRMKRHLGARKVPLSNLTLGVSAKWRFLLGHFEGWGHRILSHLNDRFALEKLY